MQVRKIFVHVETFPRAVRATCHRCKHQVNAKSIKSCLRKLNKTCERGENHVYTNIKEEANDWAFEVQPGVRHSLWPPDSIRHLP